MQNPTNPGFRRNFDPTISVSAIVSTWRSIVNPSVLTGLFNVAPISLNIRILAGYIVTLICKLTSLFKYG